MRDTRNRRKSDESEIPALDPIALTLAIWLGIVVTITALGRLAQDAEAQALATSQRGAPGLVRPAAVPFVAVGS